MSSLLEDLQSDLLADALANPAGRRVNPEWKESVTWTFGGYIARCRSISCPSCKKTVEVSDGIFAEEVGSNGTRRLTRAIQWPQNIHQRMELTYLQGEICYECLAYSLSFDLFETARDTPTNIAGEGMTTSPAFKKTLSFTRRGSD